MAAVHSPSRQQSRRRSSSDPFSDPSQKKYANPPPPPPKPLQSPRTATAPKPALVTDITDTVTPHTQPDLTGRTKVNRAHTGAALASTNSRGTSRRSQSEDTTHMTEKTRSYAKSRAKKGSKHADVIDRLDFTGVGPMFHHDGPFDACIPTRNKHRNQAPMFAWGDNPAAAQLAGSPYPSHAYSAFSNDYPDPPKKKVDAIAEAWGIHEPEPFEDFSAGGGSGRLDGDTPTSSIYNGKESHATRSSGRRPKDPRDLKRRSAMPPPQPIFTDTANVDQDLGSPPISPKRSRSIMHRIRKMRDAPNIPVGRDYESPSISPTSPTEPSRPTHRSQNSLLGRLAGGSRPNQQAQSEPFVLIAASGEGKNLPPSPKPVRGDSVSTPGENEQYADYSDSQVGEASGGIGLGRKASLIKKVGRVVRGGNK